MKVVSFFAGCGGLDLGFEQAGFEVVWANEFDPAMQKTYLLNHPRTMLVLGDINNIDPKDVPDCDGFIGGPPCQSWSMAGKQKGLDDERGQVFLTYINMIREKKPKFFLIENVKGLLNNKFKDVFDNVLQQLDAADYDVSWQLLDAANYKIPQNRERVFIIGFKKGLNISYTFPKPTCAEPIPLIRAIGDIKENPVSYNFKEAVMPNEICANHDVLKSEFNQFYHKGNRRRGWNQPSFTIHATADNIPLHPSSPKMMFFGHENWDFQKDRLNEYRRLSVRECARIQTFPDSFQIATKDIETAYKMIGNAVPPRLGKVLATSIIDHFRNNKPEQATVPEKNLLDKCILVGYFKNKQHHDCIINNRLYYVRSDGRRGSLFKEDCEMAPQYLLIHHKEQVEIYELDGEEPVLADASYLQTLGFVCDGNTYLCFRLKNDQEDMIMDYFTKNCKLDYSLRTYTPYFTYIRELIKEPTYT